MDMVDIQKLHGLRKIKVINLLREIVRIEATTFGMALLHFGLMVLFYTTVLALFIPAIEVMGVTYVISFTSWFSIVAVLSVFSCILHGKV